MSASPNETGSAEQSAVMDLDSIVQYELKNHVATLTLNRPAHYNALSEQMLTAIQNRLDQIAADNDVYLVVIAANGKAFCAGHDLKQMRATPEQDYYQTLFQQCSKMMLTISSMQQPVIAKVNGMATAAGCQMVGACDLAIASDTAKFGVSGINLGLFCSTPSVALSRNISRKRAFEMLVTGEFIDANKAAEWGLINEAVPEDQLDQSVEALCNKILQKSAVAVRTGKKMFYQQIEKDLQSAYAYAGDVMACNMMENDTTEGIDAFIGKRKPEWKHE